MGECFNKVGRDTVLTKELIDKICALVRVGNYLETSAARCGVNKTSLHNWLRLGRIVEQGGRQDPIYGEFLKKVDEAIAESETRMVARIENAGATDWRAEAWRLERRFPKRYGRREEVNMQGKLDVGLPGLLNKLRSTGDKADNDIPTHDELPE